MLLQATPPSSSPSTFSPGFSDSEPAFLGVGTEVSAKYKGAFCEAKIKNVTQLVKCRVALKGSPGSVVVTHENIKGPLRVGAVVEAKHQGSFSEATISKIMDASQYTVIFDDGDETTLRRTSLCLKSGKHYSESESLDHLPLTNPEHFGNPVSMNKGRRSRRIGRSSLLTHHGSSGPQSVSDDESGEGDCPAAGSIDDEDSAASSMTQQSEVSSIREKEELKTPEGPVGKVFVIEYNSEVKRGNKAKDLWFPGLCVNPEAQDTNSGTAKSTTGDDELLVKSFKDNRFYPLSKKDAREFDPSSHGLSLTDLNSSAALRSAVEKAIAYLDKGDLPNSWDADILLGPASSETPEANDGNDVGPASSELDSAADDEGEDEWDAGPSEEKDRMVAQLYKFMDERGTPINRAPSVGGRDLDLYRLYRVVHRMGGYNRVTNKNNWKIVYQRLGLAACHTDSLENISINQLKAAFKKYLLNFTDFYRKLGFSSAFINSPLVPTKSRPGRNERGWRGGQEKVETPVTATKTGSRRRRSITESSEVSNKPVDSPAPATPSESQEGKDDDEDRPGRRGSIKRGSIGRKGLLVKKKIGIREKDGPDSDEGGPETQRAPAGHESDTEIDESIGIGKEVEVSANDKIKVKYTKGSDLDVYEAKVVKVEKNSDVTKERYFVHYAGWNTRYDEWIKRNRIVEVVRDKSPKRRGGHKGRRGPPSEIGPILSSVAEPIIKKEEVKQEEVPPTPAPTPNKRGRPPSASGPKASAESSLKSGLKGFKGKKQKKSDPVASPASESTEDTLSKGGEDSSVCSDTKRIKIEPMESKDEKDSSQDAISADEVLKESIRQEKPSDPLEKSQEAKKDVITTLDVSKKHAAAESVAPKEVSSEPIPSDPKVTDSKKSTVTETETRNTDADIKEDDASSSSGVKSSAGKRKRFPPKEFKDSFQPVISTPISKKSPEKEEPKSSKKLKVAVEPPVPKEKDNKKKRETKGSKVIEEKQPILEEVEHPEPLKATPVPSAPVPTPSASVSTGKKRRQKESETPPPEIETTQPEEAKPEPEDKSTKRKRHEKKRDVVEDEKQTVVAPPPVAVPTVTATVTRNKKKPDDEKVNKKTEDDAINLEIARLFGDEKNSAKDHKGSSSSGGSAEKSPVQEFPPEMAGSFLLCKEEVPLSPIPTSTHPHEKDENQASSSRTQAHPSSSHSSSVPKSSQLQLKVSSSTPALNVEPQAKPPEDQRVMSPPTTPESLRHGALSSLTPPRDPHDSDQLNQKPQLNSSSASDMDAADPKKEEGRPPVPVKHTFESPVHASEDSHEKIDGPSSSRMRETKGELTASPKRKRRGRTRTPSTSESHPKESNDRNSGYKTRGTSVRKSRASHAAESDRFSPIGPPDHHLMSHPISPISGISLSNLTPNAFFANIHPTSKYNFCTPIDETLDADRRIQILQDRLSELRKTYLTIRSELVSIERRRKKSKKKERNSNISPDAKKDHHHHHHQNSSSNGHEADKSRHGDNRSADFSSDCSESSRTRGTADHHRSGSTSSRIT